MNSFPPKTLNKQADILKQTQLGQLCGQGQLFRDRYAILKILGRGGFGITFLAKNMMLPGNPLCVIKQLFPKVSSPKIWQRACDRFEKEAKILGQLGSHSQIPMLLDYFQANGEFYLVQEYVHGSTLAREIKRTGLKSEAAVKQFLHELLPVLQYVHKHHVIHRDIKPQNLLRCEDDGRVVLIDFGAVKEKLVETCDSEEHKNASTNFVGTMGFAPPEQFCLRPVYASDIYALGMTCLYFLTGKAPLEFEHDSNTGDICWQKHVDVSDHFAQVLGKMVKVSLSERFQTTNDVIYSLGLESYLPTLTNCLTTQPKKGKSSGNAESSEYLPPVARTASAIREWKAKLNAKNDPKFKGYLPQISN
ncbi:serine/threonine protein kinase [Scytonema hofmannii FACHB-248]|uniref:non-specific serine/threonine protein kinase n=1 Tax=Scytonema hofmannii FACHB-248 TaxID=1842502 RepID=A0ABR8H1J7_9CYAN|nr:MULTISPECIES: serine/threonine-protein kinase [Nostocales]MBD2609558.1 serine/threonine protein kinase [Scytonema hofmannii FACHB-248]